MNYGVRLDFLNAQVDAQDIAAGPFTPARTSMPSRTCRTGRISIRAFGVAYDLFGNGKTASKPASAATSSATSYNIARAREPRCSRRVNSVTRSWAAPAGVTYAGTFNPFDDCDLFNPAANTKRPGAVQCGADHQSRASASSRHARRTTIPISSRAGTCGRTTGKARSAFSAS